MLEFWANYGADIIAVIIALAGSITSVCAVIKMFKSENRTKVNIKEMADNIVITREGIVQAFKSAKINPDIKISLAKQVDDKLDEFKKEAINLIKNDAEIKTKLIIMLTKIMVNTAAYNKLTEEEKEELDMTIRKVVEADGLVEVYLPNKEA